MRTSLLLAYAASVPLAGSLAACGSGSPPMGLAPSTGMNVAAPNFLLFPSRSTPAMLAGLMPHPIRRKSWISPNVPPAERLLFISDASGGVVDILTLPDLALNGQITGLDRPAGLCSGALGHIWVTLYGTQQVVEYSRNGTKLKTLSDDGVPYGCAFNSKTGDLAVANVVLPNQGHGNVVIYKKASGAPSAYGDPRQKYAYRFADYDPNGNLFISANELPSYNFALLELPKGGRSVHRVRITGGSIYAPGLIQWSPLHNYLAVGDVRCEHKFLTCIYRVTISGATGKIVGNTKLSDPHGGTVCYMVQGVIGARDERFVAGADYDFCHGYENYAGRWPWPAGGTGLNINSTTGLQVPLGSAISEK
jgi:hypothetical protein